MPKPISFETELSKRRVIEELEIIEDEISRPSRDDYVGARNRLRELRLALESKPIRD